MCNGKRISIIIPLYNGRKFIEKTIVNITKLKADKEIIIIDDGSTDGSGEFCIQLKEKYPELRVYRKNNGGIFTARNMGLTLCTGDYVIFIDQDDYIDSCQADYAIEFVRNNNLDVLFWSCNYDADGKLLKCDTVYNDCIISKRDKIETKLIQPLLLRESSNYTSYLGHVWSGIYSAELINNHNIRFKRFINYEDDQLFVYDILLQARLIGFIKNTVYYWVYNPKSFSHTKHIVSDIVGKYECYFRYLTKQYKKYVKETDEKFLNELETFGYQFTFCEAVRNVGLSFAYGDKSSHYLKDLDKIENEEKYLQAIKKSFKHIHEWKYKVILLFSRLKMTKCSLWLAEQYFKV